ncbi:MAG: hypothetical protein V1744_07165 [Candidatus Altiarchaeota archaeon]
MSEPKVKARKQSGLKKFLHKVTGPWRALKGVWERFLSILPAWLSPWVRDIVDVAVTVLVIIVVLKFIFRADMLVPLVVVTSDSMVHEYGDGSWKTWMTNKGITDPTIAEFPMQNGFNMGDMILVKDPNTALGDVIIYERDLDHLTFQSKDPIIHRVVGIVHVENYQPVRSEGTLDCYRLADFNQYVVKVIECQRSKSYCPYTRYPLTGNFKFYLTKGDHNDGSDQCSTKLGISHPVTETQITGRALLRLPYLGWPKMLLSLIFQILSLPFQLL